MPCPYRGSVDWGLRELGLFCIIAFGNWRLDVGVVGLGSFCVFWLLAVGCWPCGIGFPDESPVDGDKLLTDLRPACCGIGRPARRQGYGELGLFRIFWFVVPRRAGIGSS